MPNHRPTQIASHLTLCSLFAAVLTACGGGTSDSGSASAAGSAATPSATGVSSGFATALSVSASAASTATATATTTPLTTEGNSFSVTGTQTVRFGANSSWVQQSVTGTGQCTNAFFGTDPIPGTYKSCQLVTEAASPAPAPAPGSATTIATEGGSFSVAGTQTVSFGAGSSWISMPVTGAGQCTNAFFGSDPAYGVYKSCVTTIASATATAPAPAPVSAPAPAPVATVTAWVRIAAENDSIAVTGTKTVRFGDGVNWLTKVASTGATCSIGYFGSDPSPYVTKFCESQVTVPAVVQTGTMPVVNTGLMPGAATSFTTARVRALSAAELSASNFIPSPTTVGAFREPCSYSHMAFDDPIVYPGRPGASHLHTFMGNDLAGASSTADSLSSSGGSTCAGGTLNRTGYWMPTMIDTRTGQPLPPIDGNFYYKLGYLGVQAAAVKPFPKGLRIVAGDSSNTVAVSSGSRFACLNSGSWQASIPSCAVGDIVMASVIFPQCWDGVNLDSPDHKSHMAYATGTGCPSDHPVALPEITIRFDYKVTEANNGTYWKLSSDNYSGPGGYSLHADWFDGWDSATNMSFVTNCLNGNLDCHDELLGDGRILY